MTTDTSEKGLETLIFNSLVQDAGYLPGDNADYDRRHVVDLAKLRQFLRATQPKAAEPLALDSDGPKRNQSACWPTIPNSSSNTATTPASDAGCPTRFSRRRICCKIFFHNFRFCL